MTTETTRSSSTGRHRDPAAVAAEEISSARPGEAIVGDWEGTAAGQPGEDLAAVLRRLRGLYTYLLGRRAAWANNTEDPNAIPRAIVYQHVAGMVANVIQGAPPQDLDESTDAYELVPWTEVCSGCLPPGTPIVSRGQVVGHVGETVPVPDDAARFEIVFGAVTAEPSEECGSCFACIGHLPAPGTGGLLTVGMTRMICCATCGNKRCPHGTDHRLECTGSNASGQPGSRY